MPHNYSENCSQTCLLLFLFCIYNPLLLTSFGAVFQSMIDFLLGYSLQYDKEESIYYELGFLSVCREVTELMRDGGENQGTLMYMNCRPINSSKCNVPSLLNSYIHVFQLFIDMSSTNKNSITVVIKNLTGFCLWFLRG